MNPADLLKNPKFQTINPQKLLLLNQLLSQADVKSQEELIPFLLAASSKAGQSGMSFTDEETELIISVLSEKMTDAEKARIETIRNLSKLIKQKR